MRSASSEAAFISIKNSSVVVAVMGTQSMKALYHKDETSEKCKIARYCEERERRSNLVVSWFCRGGSCAYPVQPQGLPLHTRLLRFAHNDSVAHLRIFQNNITKNY